MQALTEHLRRLAATRTKHWKCRVCRETGRMFHRGIYRQTPLWEPVYTIPEIYLPDYLMVPDHLCPSCSKQPVLSLTLIMGQPLPRATIRLTLAG
jgi:hypothetical protein